MKKISIIILFLLFYIPLHSQQIFNLVKASKPFLSPVKTSLTIQGVTVVDKALIERAIAVAEFNVRYKNISEFHTVTNLKGYKNNEVILIDRTINQELCNPQQVYGTYSYLKICTANFSQDKRWKHIKDTDGYNGVHHIITASFINYLHKESIKSFENGIISTYPFLNNMKIEAPALLHPLHNDTRYKHVFHDSQAQFRIYQEKGVSGILDKFFLDISLINHQNKLPQLDEQLIKSIYLESRLWTEYYGLKWE